MFDRNFILTYAQNFKKDAQNLEFFWKLRKSSQN